MSVTADYVIRKAIDGGREVDVVRRARNDDPLRHSPLHDHRKGSERFDPEIYSLFFEAKILAKLRIAQAPPKLVEHSRRGNDLEGVIPQKTDEDPARRALRTDQTADDHVRVENGTHEGTQVRLRLRFRVRCLASSARWSA